MAAYIVVHFTPINGEKLQEYGAAVPSTLVKHNGELLARGPKEMLHGPQNHRTQVIIAFPSKEDAVNWYNSSEYQALIPLRDQGMLSEFHLV